LKGRVEFCAHRLVRLLAVVQTDPQKSEKGLVLFSNEIMVAEGKSRFLFCMSHASDYFSYSDHLWFII